jgi:hypothetical protein
MNKIAAFIMVLLVIAGSSLASVTTTFQLGELSDLPHASWFTWGVPPTFTLAPGDTITRAVLTYHNIYDWRVEQDRLATRLLDNVQSGVRQGNDIDGGNDYFAGKGTLLYRNEEEKNAGGWNDPQGGSARNFDLVYDFGALGFLDVLNAYAKTPPGRNQANFGFGIDPDCHYYNDGVTFEITTASNVVPAPGAVLLGGIGITLVGWMRRRRAM